MVLPTIANPLPAIIEQAARKVFESFSERMKASLNGRQERALQLAVQGHVTHKTGRIYSVRSQNGAHAYLVDLDRKFCNCPDSQKGNICKHRIAAYLIEQANQVSQSSPMSVPNSDETFEKVRLILNARSAHLREAIIYATLQIEIEPLQVEIIALDGEVAVVRALPVLKDGQLVPQFPFPDRKASTQVIAKSLTNVRIFR